MWSNTASVAYTSAAQGETDVDQKIITWGLAGAAFIVTLGISSWQEGLWRSDQPSARTGDLLIVRDSIRIPQHPFEAASSSDAAPPLATPVIAARPKVTAAIPLPPPPMPTQTAQSQPERTAEMQSSTADAPSSVDDLDDDQSRDAEWAVKFGSRFRSHSLDLIQPN